MSTKSDSIEVCKCESCTAYRHIRDVLNEHEIAPEDFFYAFGVLMGLTMNVDQMGTPDYMQAFTSGMHSALACADAEDIEQTEDVAAADDMGEPPVSTMQ